MTQKDENRESSVEKLETSELAVVGTKNSQLKELLTESAEENREEEEENLNREVQPSRDDSDVLASVDEAQLAELVDEIASAPPSDLKVNLDPHVAEALRATPRPPNANASLLSIITEKSEEQELGDEVRAPERPPLPSLSAEEAARRVPEPLVTHEEKAYGGVDELEELLAKDNEPEKPEVKPVAEVDGSIVAPGYWQGFEGRYGRLNVFAFLGLAFIVIFFPLGFFFSLIGLHNTRAVPDDKVGKIVSWAGLGISSLLAVITLIYIVLTPILWGLQLLPYAVTGVQP